MHEGTNFKKIGEVPNSVLRPLIAVIESFDWKDNRYDQPFLTSPALTGGKTFEFPFIKRHPSTVSRSYNNYEQILLSASFDLFNWLYDFLGSDVIFVRCELSTLMPKTEIRWHIDNNHAFFKHCKRVHVPLTSNENCKQLWKTEETRFEVGGIYEYNNLIWHSALNDGDTFRTTLILDYIHDSSWNKLVEMGIFKNTDLTLGYFKEKI